MLHQIAIKRLTASDLTLFEWHYRNRPAGNQKAINLNADVFIDQLYPSLPSLVQSSAGKIPLDLFIFGPGLGAEYNLQRKIVKLASYKNWRLNGEFIFNPMESPERFNSLQPGDLAVLDFGGDVVPTSARLVLLSSNVPEDQLPYHLFDSRLAEMKMIALPLSEFEQLLQASKVPDHHPVRALALGEEIEDAVLGGGAEARQTFSRRTGRKLSKQDLQRAKANADNIGNLGEHFVNYHLQKRKGLREIADFDWVSTSNAVAALDFTIVALDSGVTSLDVKSTVGSFERPLHISLAELLEMREAPQYEIYRVYEVSENMAKLKIARDLKLFAEKTLAILEQLPEGVRPDGISVLPDLLSFGSEQILEGEPDN